MLSGVYAGVIVHEVRSGCSAHKNLHLSPTCLTPVPHLSPRTLWMLYPHDFTCVGDKRKTNVKSSGQSIQSALGDKWQTSGDKPETNVKSCGQSIQSVPGDKSKTSGVTVGDKCKIMLAEDPERIGRQVGDKRRQVGDKCKSTSGDKWETNVESRGQSIQSVLETSGDKGDK